jgi:hypothetical protein
LNGYACRCKMEITTGVLEELGFDAKGFTVIDGFSGI